MLIFEILTEEHAGTESEIDSCKFLSGKWELSI